MEPAALCAEIIARQHGAISRKQAFGTGLTRGAIDRWLSSGQWRVVHPGVYVATTVPSSWHQRLMAAVLCGGRAALASHRSSALLWRLDGVAGDPIEISVNAGRRIKGVIVHRRQLGDDPAVEVRSGIPTTGIERTLLDLAAVSYPRRTALALDDALRRRLTTLEAIKDLIGGLRGRAGTGSLRKLIEVRDERDARLESRLESALLNLLRSHGLPLPEPQHVVREGHRVVARLDFAYAAQRLGLETDGYRWHSGVERWKRDIRRENHLKLLGWTLLRFTWEDVQDDPETVAMQIRDALILSGSLR